MKTILIKSDRENLVLTLKLRDLGLIDFVYPNGNGTINYIKGVTEEAEKTINKNPRLSVHCWRDYNTTLLRWNYFRMNVAQEVEEILKNNKIEFIYE